MTRGIIPRRAASRMSRASPVVSIQPDQGGSVHVVDEPWVLLWESGGDDMRGVVVLHGEQMGSGGHVVGSERR